MKRVKLSVAILAVMAVVSILSGIWVDRRCSEMAETAGRAAELFLSGDTEGAVNTAEELVQDWENFRKTAAIFLLNNKLSDIDRMTARIPSLARNNSADLVTDIRELKQMLKKLR